MVIQLAEQKTPKNLFRFRSVQSEYFWTDIEEAVKKRRFFLSGANFLNDPFEFRPIYEASNLEQVLSAQIEHFGSNPIVSKATAEEMLGRPLSRQAFRREFRKLKPSEENAAYEVRIVGEQIALLKEKARVACFSENIQSIPMWGHYSDNHMGVCLHFEQCLDDHVSGEPIPMPVKYGVTRPIISTLEFNEFTQRSTSGSLGSSDVVFDGMYLQKSSHWSYEEEWRIFENSDEEPRYHQVSMLKPKSIIFGLRSNETLMREVYERFGDDVQVLQCSMSKTEFELTFHPISS